jgi:CDP-glycerol glycerophosphotransferase
VNRKQLAARASETARTAVTAIGKRVPLVLDAAREAVIAERRHRYRRLCARTPVDERCVLFQSYGGRGYACTPRGVYELMLAEKRFADYELVWTLRADVARGLAELGGYDVRGLESIAAAPTPPDDLRHRFGEEALDQLKRAVIVVYGSYEHFKAHARAAYWISNSIIHDHLLTRDGQYFVQAWHGTPLKRLGCDITQDAHATYTVDGIHKRYRREGSRMSYLVAQSDFAAEKLGSAFDLLRTGQSAKILVTGYPRNDALAHPRPEAVAAARRRVGVPEGKKVVLYAPTWRDDEHNAALGFTHRIGADFERLRTSLGDDYVVLFRAHYLIASNFDFSALGDFVIDVSAINDINELYLMSDLLVTDYSSVFFDYAVLGRPIVFYMYDLERYAEEIRGFYLDLSELPGPIVKNEGELAAAIIAAGSPSAEQDDRLKRFRERFAPLDDGLAAARLLTRIGL